jgi:hypothetical protein
MKTLIVALAFYGLSAATQAATPGSLSPADNQTKVCTVFTKGAAEFAPLQQAWKQTQNNTNGVARTMAQDTLRQKINAVWTNRNRTVLDLMPAKKFSGWVAQLDKLDMVERDYGNGTQRYIEIEGRFDCVLPVTFTSKQIEVTPKLVAILTKVKMGDSVILDGTLIAHDSGAQPIEDSVEWGGILWGPLGGLWGDDAFNRPAFQIKTTNIAVP